MASNHQKLLLQKRRWRIRKKVNGTSERPRLVVKFTHLHIYAQLIDDVAGKTLVYASTLNKDVKPMALKPNLKGAAALAEIAAKKAKSLGISQVVFDRAGRTYHGCVKAFAEAARQSGLVF